METSYFNSNLPTKDYKKLKIEAIELNITIKKHISNVLKAYVRSIKDEIPLKDFIKAAPAIKVILDAAKNREVEGTEEISSLD